MQQPHLRRAARLLSPGLLALGLVALACSSDPPAAPTPTPAPSQPAVSQTLTITSAGVFPTLAYVDTDQVIQIVNGDSIPHQLHLDEPDQPGCAGFDTGGIVQPGQTVTTSMITNDSAGCDVHDHAHHGDPRFMVQLVVGESSR